MTEPQEETRPEREFSISAAPTETTAKNSGSSVSDYRPGLQDSHDASQLLHLQDPEPLVLDLALGVKSVERLLVCDSLKPPSTHHPSSHCSTCSCHLCYHHTSSASKTHLSRSSAHSQQRPGDDLCASVLLACLFCRVEECVSAAVDGLQQCVSCLCSELCSRLCCCDPASLEPVLEACPGCDPGGCVDSYLCSDCAACELCLHATECLEFGMEISQLLFH
ncbi:uncharacterized protein si:dkey-245f22.3 [Astyanax mexicanus]|uniref:MyoD family inhibitor domain containing n=1 Tax=Astyanax mexicanus TaxID=7994 RepID=A0A8T2KT30_ASTMX|nr:uncharacterized protein si:dkey-245f22.3 [Astyanax mexicanus]KAG9260146.1 hypothetical protein AMEX_G26376 [Astyanax mexicanus]